MDRSNRVDVDVDSGLVRSGMVRCEIDAMSGQAMPLGCHAPRSISCGVVQTGVFRSVIGRCDVV